MRTKAAQIFKVRACNFTITFLKLREEAEGMETLLVLFIFGTFPAEAQAEKRALKYKRQNWLQTGPVILLFDHSIQTIHHKGALCHRKQAGQVKPHRALAREI